MKCIANRLAVLVIAVAILCSGVANALLADSQVVTSSELSKQSVYVGPDVPDGILLPSGREFSLLRSAGNVQAIVEWAEEHNSLLCLQRNVLITTEVDPAKRIWAALLYECDTQWKLTGVAAIELPEDVSISSARYDASADMLLVFSDTGRLVKSATLGRKKEKTIRPLHKGWKPATSKCSYSYPNVPESLSAGPGLSRVPLLLSAKNVCEIAAWAQKHDFYILQSVGREHIVVATISGSGAMIFRLDVYVKSSQPHQGVNPWTLACVGNVHLGDYDFGGMYIDQSSRELGLTHPLGGVVTKLRMNQFAVRGKQ